MAKDINRAHHATHSAPTPAVMYNDSHMQLQFSLPRGCFLTGSVQR